MKKIFLLVFITFLSITFIKAQELTAALHHSGSTTFFRTSSAFSDAHSAAQNGDTIYLSGGFFSSISLSKRLVIIGAGHYPDSTKVTGVSYLYSTLYINSGADSSLIEGLYINGDVSFQSDASMHDVTIRRCNFSSLGIGGSSSNNIRTLINQNIIRGNVDFSNAITLSFKNNILIGRIYNATNTILFDHNELLICIGYNNGNCFTTVSNVLFTNNIIDVSWGSWSGWLAGENNTFQNNIFDIDPSGWSNNIFSNNIINISTDTIFVNRTHCTGFDYTQDYHLKSTVTGRNAATDGTDIGIYGGLPQYAFKLESVPMNPHISSKYIAPNTNSNGKLNVNIKVSAQDR